MTTTLTPRRSPRRDRRIRDVRLGPLVLLGGLALHSAIGLVAARTTLPVANVQAFATVIAAVAVATLASSPMWLAAMMAYAATCDVFWRMSGASVPWEGAKYLVVALGVVAIARFTWGTRRMGLPLAFLALLAPGAWITYEHVALGDVGDQASFVLSAALVIVVTSLFFSRMRATPEAVTTMLWAALGPITIVAVVATVGAAGLQPEDFSSTVSSFGASGGYGPNQVSGLLGFGVLAGVALAAFERRLYFRALGAGMALWFATAAGLTFSRGGLFNVMVAATAASIVLLRDGRAAIRVAGAALVVFAILSLAVLPGVEALTGGRFGDRYTDLSTTLRTDLALDDLQIARDNWLTGVGVGQADTIRADLEERGASTYASHTEYTRLLAEHGLFGLLALMCLVVMVWRAYRQQESLMGRAWTAALIGWSMAAMLHMGTRIAIIPFALGMTPCVVASAGRRSPTPAIAPAGDTTDGRRDEPVRTEDRPPASVGPAA